MRTLAVLAGWLVAHSPARPLSRPHLRSLSGTSSHADSQPGADWAQRFDHSNEEASPSFKKVSSSFKNGSTCHPPKATAVQHLVQPTKGRQDPGRKACRSPHQEARCKCRITLTTIEMDWTRTSKGRITRRSRELLEDIADDA